MIVEFIGAPGAGKTTLLPAAADFFREQNRQAFTIVAAARPFARRTIAGKVVHRLSPRPWRDPLLWQLFYRLSILYRLKFIATHPQLIWQVANYQRRRPAAADVRQRKVLYWFYRLLGYYEFLRAHARPDEVLVFDEGFLHRVVQLFASSVEAPDEAQIDNYVALLPRPDLVVFVCASRDTCERRIYSRGLWERQRHKEPAEITQFVDNAHLAVERAVAHARRKGWSVVEVDNERDDRTAASAELRRQLALVLPFVGAPLALQTV